MNKQQKQFNWQVKVLDEANHIIEMVGSTEDYDRVGDKMLMTGAKLQNYLKNPVILANHNYGDSERPTVIGRALSVVIQNSQLIFKIQFADTDNGREWFYLYSNGYMNASSIGFIPLKYKPNDQGGYDFKEWELLELSLVAVPCNPNAIQRAFEDGKISKAFFDAINKNNEEDIENMKVKDVQALIDKAVESKVGNIKKNYETEINDKTKEIEILSSKNKDLEVQLEQKAGATLSTKSKETLKDICEGLKSHAATLEKMLGDNDDPKGDEEKEYSEEDIQKAVQEKIEKALNGGK
ncbi:HK97 family phage prohead protease [Clostridium sp. JN-9]|uniref:HK97 family phage prohead protease n=1 Tax=Clostridium sp. JN-9 TaxID=2507159 RepID=UPI000FFDFCAD|nr:HK97 family phage prohead protease [Clostridium sp. JN-9]QAT40843.1 hypothetical protein EQM05_11535 [Clostridium sp. JN-9]